MRHARTLPKSISISYPKSPSIRTTRSNLSSYPRAMMGWARSLVRLKGSGERLSCTRCLYWLSVRHALLRTDQCGVTLTFQVSEAYFKFVDTDWEMDHVQGESVTASATPNDMLGYSADFTCRESKRESLGPPLAQRTHDSSSILGIRNETQTELRSSRSSPSGPDRWARRSQEKRWEARCPHRDK